jgi:hypothetical protein
VNTLYCIRDRNRNRSQEIILLLIDISRKNCNQLFWEQDIFSGNLLVLIINFSQLILLGLDRGGGGINCPSPPFVSGKRAGEFFCLLPFGRKLKAPKMKSVKL